jgi:hypothetical protein
VDISAVSPVSGFCHVGYRCQHSLCYGRAVTGPPIRKFRVSRYYGNYIVGEKINEGIQECFLEQKDVKYIWKIIKSPLNKLKIKFK